MATIGGWIADVLHDIDNTAKQDAVKAEVHSLCEGFPVYR